MHIIKELRRKKGISQTKFAQEIGVSLRTVQLYERKDANIPMKNLRKIADFFEMTVPELFIHEFHDPQGTYKRKPYTKHGSVFYPLDHGKYLIMSPLVLQEQQQEYLTRIKTGTVSQNAFQSGFVVDFVDDEPYTAFEITGDSMFDGSLDSIPNKAIVLGQQQELDTLNPTEKTVWDKPYVLVCKDRVICKKLLGLNASGDSILCANLNKSPEFQDFELPLTEVLQLFKIAKKQL